MKFLKNISFAAHILDRDKWGIIKTSQKVLGKESF
jgi:hypothetical protein